MDKIISYPAICGNEVTVYQDDYDYEVRINNMVVLTTGDESEAEMIAESIHVSLTMLDIQKRLVRQRSVFSGRR